MNAKILILLILILIISTMQQRNSEKFTNGKMSKKYRGDNCTQNNNLLNKVHKYESYSCNIDDSKTNDQVINDRMNCRSFNEKKIYLKNDVKGWCKENDELPKIYKINKHKEFNGLGLLQKNESSNDPDADDDMTASYSTAEFSKKIEKNLPNYDNRKKK